jgi:hypothetical protein
MNNEHRQIANSILDRHKDGEQFSQFAIDQALRDTGDLAPNGGEVLDQAIQEESQGGGSVRSISMVAENLVRLGEKTWTTRR